MAEKKIKVFIQKRTSLRAQLTQLTNAVNENQPDKNVIELRFKRVTDLLHAYEEIHDEWSVLKPTDERLNEFTEIQNDYYVTAGKVGEILKPTNTNARVANQNNAADTAPNDNSRRLRLPVADLPKFNGDYEKWLPFKNTFAAMIDTRDDITDVEKFLLLKSNLVGDALTKISVLTASAENYKQAWINLEKSYEVKKIIVTRHLSSLLNLPQVNSETHDALMKLVDEARQHVTSLASLGVTIGSEMLAQIVDSKLPRKIADKWDETVSADEVPQFDKLCDFITSTAVRLAKHKRPYSEFDKRDHNKNHPSKRARHDNQKHVFVLQTNACSCCKKEQHPLYRCQTFKDLSVPNRIAHIKQAKLCFNCMRSHSGQCKSSNCTKCNRKHNTLLHLERSDNSGASYNTAAASKPDTKND